MSFTDAGGTTIHWIEQGAGDPPFVLLPGWGSSTVKWQDALPMLAVQRRAITLDLPGFGRSSVPRGSYSPEWFAGGLRAFLDEIGVERAILAGNSLGGLVAMTFASAWPERVAGLVLVGSVFPNDGKQPSARILAQMAVPLVPGVGELMYRTYSRRAAASLVEDSMRRNVVDPARVRASTRNALIEETERRAREPERARAILQSQRQMMWSVTGRREQTWRIARGLTVPTLLVWGEKDAMLPLHIGERAVKEIPGAELIVLPDCGHNPQMEMPEEFSNAVLTWARGLT